jgi:hypothetical protein
MNTAVFCTVAGRSYCTVAGRSTTVYLVILTVAYSMQPYFVYMNIEVNHECSDDEAASIRPTS